MAKLLAIPNPKFTFRILNNWAVSEAKVFLFAFWWSQVTLVLFPLGSHEDANVPDGFILNPVGILSGNNKLVKNDKFYFQNSNTLKYKYMLLKNEVEELY